MGILSKLFGAMQSKRPVTYAPSPDISKKSVPDAKLVRAAFHAWMRDRINIDVEHYKRLTEDELKGRGEFVFHTQKYGTGITYQRTSGYPDFFVRVLRGEGKSNEIFFEYTVKSPEEWNDMEKMIRELASIVGEEICSEKEFVEMRKGRTQTGQRFTLTDGYLFGVMVNWKTVSVTL